MRQEVSRVHSWALDTVTLHNEVTQFTRETVKDPPKVCAAYCISCYCTNGFNYWNHLFTFR